MARLAQSGAPGSYIDIRNLRWSETEKAIARNAFDHALRKELEEVVHKTQRMAATIHQPSDLWELESFLTRRRKEIDDTFDYRYSVLPEVFGALVREGRVYEDELLGLAEDKLAYIRKFARL